MVVLTSPCSVGRFEREVVAVEKREGEIECVGEEGGRWKAGRGRRGAGGEEGGREDWEPVGEVGGRRVGSAGVVESVVVA